MNYSDVQNLQQDLVQKIKSGEKKSFELLYDQYAPALYGIILKILQQDTASAQDSLQDSFVKIWKNIAAYDESKGSIFTWMLTIARRTALDKLDSIKNKKIQNLDSPVNIAQDQFQTHSSIDGIGVSELVNRLQPDHQILISLAYFQGYTQEEIAQKLNMPLGTVKTKTRAAMQELRNRIK
jgi:RNA polymerase sigma-70 factor (ECF subfamily)